MHPVYHPDVEVFEVKDADGSHMGIFYVDYFPRPGKTSIVNSDGVSPTGLVKLHTLHTSGRISPFCSR